MFFWVTGNLSPKKNPHPRHGIPRAHGKAWRNLGVEPVAPISGHLESHLGFWSRFWGSTMMILARLRSLLFLTTVSLDLKKKEGVPVICIDCVYIWYYTLVFVQQILINMSCVCKCLGYILNDHWLSLAVTYHAIMDVHFTTQQCNISPAKLVFVIPCLTWWDAAASSGFVMQFAMNDGSWMPLAWKTLILRAMWLSWVGLNQFR